MSSKYLTILPAAAALLLATACSNDDMDGLSANGLVAAQVTADISDGESVTRVSIDSDTGTASFAVGDEIHVVTDGITYDYIKGTDKWSAESTPYYFQNSEEVSFQGWYSTTAASNNSISINTTSQETDNNGWNEWDILATPVVTTDVTSPTVYFTNDNAFKHQMSQATFTFTAGDGIADLEDLTEYTLSGLITDATFDTQAFTLTAGTTTSDITQEVTGTSDEELECTPIILVPQDVTNSDFSLEVTYDEQTYTTQLTLPNEATALATGTHYAFNVIIAKTGLTVKSAEIKSWSKLTAETSSASLKGYTYNENTNTYTVYSENGLLAWAEYTRSTDMTTNCTLANDITLSTVTEGESNWTAVGDINNQYTGTFDGNGKTITNLTISASSSDQGLIGVLGSGGVVKNLTLADVSISNTDNIHTGAVVGISTGTVTNCCFASGTVSGSDYIGGVVGYNNDKATVTACSAMGIVSGSNRIGGVVGFKYGGSVIACYSTATVSGSYMIGGVVGENSYGPVTACYSTGSVSGTSATGGVVGQNLEGTVTACYWTNSSSDDGASTYGIGYDYSATSGSNDGATKVENDVTWAIAASAMNEELTDSGWQYDGDGTSTPPLTLVEE